MTAKERDAVVEAIVGLLSIAELAMPDTYFATDSRVKKAQRLLKKLRS